MRRNKKGIPSVPAETALASEIGIKKTDEFVKFLRWCSFPDVFKGKSRDYLLEIGIKEPELLELLAIKTQKEFADTYKVRPATLTAWNQTIDEQGLKEDTKKFFAAMSKNVYGAFYHATLQHADAHRVRLWREVFEDAAPEHSIPQANQNIAVQMNTFVVALKGEFTSKLREHYETLIRGGQIPGQDPSGGGVRPAIAGPGQTGNRKRNHTNDSKKDTGL